MLNLKTPIRYTREEQALIDAAFIKRKDDGSLLTGKELWGKSDLKKIRGRISVRTLLNQGCRCAYCECLMLEKVELDHIAHKGNHRDFTYEPENLVSACGRCNKTGVKGAKETIVGAEVKPYNSNTFNIVHPYLCPDPDAEIVFQDADRVFFDLSKCTQLGLDTIAFFDWSSPASKTARLREAKMREIPLGRREIMDLVKEISTYQG